MFTLQQVKTAHAKVKSGADFPRYIAEIKALDLERYIFSVVDGSTTYYGANGYEVASPAIYPAKTINVSASPETLRQNIATTSRGKRTLRRSATGGRGRGMAMDDRCRADVVYLRRRAGRGDGGGTDTAGGLLITGSIYRLTEGEERRRDACPGHRDHRGN